MVLFGSGPRTCRNAKYIRDGPFRRPCREIVVKNQGIDGHAVPAADGEESCRGQWRRGGSELDEPDLLARAVTVAPSGRTRVE